MSTVSHPHVTLSKTLLNDIHIMNLIETITRIIYYLLYMAITIPIMLILISSIIRDTKELRAWAKGEDPTPDAENNL